MEIFLFCLISITIYCFVLNLLPINAHIRKKIFSIITFIQLFLICALRADSIGGDLSNYIPAYRNIATCDWPDIFQRWEPGFMLFIKLLTYISASPRWFIIAVSFLILTLLFYYIYNNSPSVWISLLLFIVLGYYSNTMNILRHSIALMITLNSITDIINRNFIKFACKIILAASFQITSLVFILAYTCAYIQFSYLKYMITICTSFLISILGGSVSILYFVISIFLSKYEEFSINEIGGGYSLICLMIIIVSLLYIVYKQTRSHISKDLQKKINIYFNLQLIGIIFQILFAPLFGAATRVSIFFFCPIIILIPIVINTIRSYNYKLLAIAITGIIVIGIYSFTGGIKNSGETQGTNSDYTLPYYFYWEKTNLY